MKFKGEIKLEHLAMERHDFMRASNLMPTYFMVHPWHASVLRGQHHNALRVEANDEFMGMKIIWTTSIKENEVICSYGLDRP